jgi:hypothetical protein
VRTIHLLLGVAMILTGYSILVDNQAFDTSAIPALRDYLYVLFGLGTVAFIWVAVVRRIAEPKRESSMRGSSRSLICSTARRRSTATSSHIRSASRRRRTRTSCRW